MYEITYTTAFDAAHFLRAYEGKDEPIHGHRWKVRVGVQIKELDTTGIAFDFLKLKSLVEKEVEPYDHQLLNDIKSYSMQNPTAEYVAKTLHDQLKKQLPQHDHLWVKIWEKEDSTATYWEDSVASQ
jgi:6-pyruvoyltetrahydropterin/6-carboxytetrahydropterin synthase